MAFGPSANHPEVAGLAVLDAPLRTARHPPAPSFLEGQHPDGSLRRADLGDQALTLLSGLDALGLRGLHSAKCAQASVREVVKIRLAASRRPSASTYTEAGRAIESLN